IQVLAATLIELDRAGARGNRV
ncbi:MAG: hypothetical protein QOF99_693, partial [Pseudonocardiales bacterium]|nr:hypothetical protein [Pseudonocardiales bacterium]